MTLTLLWLSLSLPLSPLLLPLVSFLSASCIHNSLRLKGMSWCTAQISLRDQVPIPLPPRSATCWHFTHHFSSMEITLRQGTSHTQGCAPSLREAHYLLTGQCGRHLMGQPSCLDEDNSEVPSSFRAPHVICRTLCCKSITIKFPLIPNFAFHIPHRFFFPKNTH